MMTGELLLYADSAALRTVNLALTISCKENTFLAAGLVPFQVALHAHSH